MFGDVYPQKTFEQTMELFDKVLELARYNNVVLKWSHAPGDMLTPTLKDAIEAFGADRIMWASDYSVNILGESWEDILNGIRKNIDLTDQEIKMILGGTVLKYLHFFRLPFIQPSADAV